MLSANNTGRGHLSRQEMLKSFDTFEVSSSNADMKAIGVQRYRGEALGKPRNIVVKCDSRQPRHAFGQKRVETLCINIVDPKRIHGAPRNAIPIHHRFPQRKFALRLDYNVDLSSQE